MRRVSRRSGALRKVALKPRMPKRTKAPFIRLTMRVRSPTRVSRSRLGRRLSSSASVGGQRRDRRHGAMLRLAAQPAEEGALEQLGVEPVDLGAPVIPLHRNAGRVDDMGLDAMFAAPTRSPTPEPPLQRRLYGL